VASIGWAVFWVEIEPQTSAIYCYYHSLYNIVHTLT
jgi:hypothetical protein